MTQPRHQATWGFALVAAALLAACSSVERREDVAGVVEGVSEEHLRAHVEALVAIGPRPGGDAAATEATCRYIEEALEASGYAPRRETFPSGGGVLSKRVEADGTVVAVLSPGGPQPRSNVIAEVVGTLDPETVVEVGAHYDTVIFSSGADDNASGVAALLEIARVLRHTRPECTIRFVFFALEEQGLRGSRAHVERMPAGERERFLGLLNLEMVGFAALEPDTQRSPVSIPFLSWGTTADFIVVLGNFSSGSLGNVVEDSIDTYVPELPCYSLNRIGGWFDDGYRSDHVPYWEAGMRAVQITDTGEFRTPHYHRSSDLAEELEFPFLQRVTRGTAAAALHLAVESN